MTHRTDTVFISVAFDDFILRYHKVKPSNYV